MKLVWEVKNVNEWPECIDYWNGINGAGPRSPVLDPDFVGAALRWFGTGKEKIVIGFSSGEAVVAGIFSPTGFGRWQTFQPSQAPLGAWVQRDNVELVPTTRQLFDVLPGFPVLLSITQQDPDLIPRPVDSNKNFSLDYIKTARVHCCGKFEDYWASRGRNLRHNMKRQRNKLAKRGVRTKLNVLADEKSVKDAISVYGLLETSGWKGRQGTAVSIDNIQGKFYVDLLSRFSVRGQGAVFQYFYDDQVVASDVCIWGFGCFCVLKTAHDESISDTSPAFLMRQEYFPILFSRDDIFRIEFYGKLMDWHTKWSDDVRTMYHCNVWRNATFSSLRKILDKIRK